MDKNIAQDEQKVVKRGRPKGSKDIAPRKNHSDLSWKGNKSLLPSEMGRFIRQARSSLELPDIDISDVEQIKERIDWYFDRCEESDSKPTITGLCNAIGIDRKTLYRWEQGHYRSQTHQKLIKRYKGILEELWEIEMVEGKINPIVGIFLGKNHFGYTDKQEYILEPRQTVVEPTQMEDILSIYSSDDDLEEY